MGIEGSFLPLLTDTDVVCLADSSRPFSGTANPTQLIAGWLGMALVHGPSFHLHFTRSVLWWCCFWPQFFFFLFFPAPPWVEYLYSADSILWDQTSWFFTMMAVWEREREREREREMLYNICIGKVAATGVKISISESRLSVFCLEAKTERCAPYTDTFIHTCT